MKLVNQTKCPDEILIPLLKKLGKNVGARITDTAVVVKQGRSGAVSGTAKNCFSSTKYGLNGMQFDGGYITITLPSASYIRIPSQSCNMYDSISFAQTFTDILAHEWGHIRDYQEGDYAKNNSFQNARMLGHSRRVKWAHRPEERRAEAYMKDCKEKMAKGELPNVDEEILILAEWFEQRHEDIKEEDLEKSRKRLEKWNRLRILKKANLYMGGVDINKLWERFKDEPAVLAAIEKENEQKVKEEERRRELISATN